MIQSFKSRETEVVFNGVASRDYPADIQRVARRKLEQLNSIGTLAELRVPPGNRLEKLSGDREGQYSIRINDQWRVCFLLTESGPAEVEIVDYH